MSAQTVVWNVRRAMIAAIATTLMVAGMIFLASNVAFGKGKPPPAEPATCPTGLTLEQGLATNKGYVPTNTTDGVTVELVFRETLVKVAEGATVKVTGLVFTDDGATTFAEPVMPGESTTDNKKLKGKAVGYAVCGVSLESPTETATTTAEPTTTTPEPTATTPTETTTTTTTEPTPTETTTTPAPQLYSCVFTDPNFEGVPLEFWFDHTVDDVVYPTETQFVLGAEFWRFEVEAAEGSVVRATVTYDDPNTGELVTQLSETLTVGESDFCTLTP